VRVDVRGNEKFLLLKIFLKLRRCRARNFVGWLWRNPMQKAKPGVREIKNVLAVT
jgi:hypothetical protein